VLAISAIAFTLRVMMQEQASDDDLASDDARASALPYSGIQGIP